MTRYTITLEVDSEQSMSTIGRAIAHLVETAIEGGYGDLDDFVETTLKSYAVDVLD